MLFWVFMICIIFVICNLNINTCYILLDILNCVIFLCFSISGSGSTQPSLVPNTQTHMHTDTEQQWDSSDVFLHAGRSWDGGNPFHIFLWVRCLFSFLACHSVPHLPQIQAFPMAVISPFPSLSLPVPLSEILQLSPGSERCCGPCGLTTKCRQGLLGLLGFAFWNK